MHTSAPVFPRFQNGTPSQQLLTVLLGDYWHTRRESIPSAALVDLLNVFDVTASGARAAIQRLAQRGFLTGTKEGRRTAYSVSQMSRERINSHVSALFMGHLAPPWDGTWTLVGYSLPEDAKGTRRLLRDQLRQLHFGNLYDAFWIRPGNQLDSVNSLTATFGAELNQDQLATFTGARLPEGTGLDSIHAAFGLPHLAEAYSDFVDRWETLARKLQNGDESSLEQPGSEDRPGEAALRLRTSIMADWRTLRSQDPRLPHELLGPDYPMHRAVIVCAAVYDSLAPTAEAAVRRIMLLHDEQLAGLITHHTFAASASLLSGN